MTDLNSACSHGVSPLELLPLGPFFSLSPEKLVPTSLQTVDPQNIAQAGLALPGGKRMLKLSPACCTQTFPLYTSTSPQRRNAEMWPMRSWGNLYGDRKQQIQLSLKQELVLWLQATLSSKQNNVILVSVRTIELDVHPEAEEHFTAANHDCVRQVIRQLEQLSVKKTPCLEMRAKKGRQENSCRFFSLEVFHMVMMQEQEAGEKRREGEHRRDTELWAVSYFGQGIQKLIVAPVNLRWHFLSDWFCSSKSSVKNLQRTPITHYLGFGAIKWLFATLTFWHCGKPAPLLRAQSCLQASPWGAVFPISLQQPVLLLGNKICFVCLGFWSLSCMWLTKIRS